jgi:2-(1,2-epoxy-1,2-dihydrophenyl)acetyl-CoA isomerase
VTTPDPRGGGIEVERDAGVVTLRLNRPKTRNAITEDDIDAMIEALRTVSDSPDDRALLLTGSGGSFCAGIDLSKPLNRSVPTFMRRVGELSGLLHRLGVPTVACVSGPAVGVGFSLALACDLILACSDAYFSMPFHKRGLSLDGGASWLLPHRVGVGRAKEIALLADRIPAARAEVIGLADRVVQPADLDAVAREWMLRLAKGPPLAQRMSKELLNNSHSASLETALLAEANAQAVAFNSDAAKEGMKAFKEKREPIFPNE